MTEREIFFNNIIDSILSISLEYENIPILKSSTVKVSDSVTKSIETKFFSLNLKGKNSKFEIILNKKESLWMPKYYLRIDHRNIFPGNRTASSYYYNSKDNHKRLADAFNFLLKRVDDVGIFKEEENLKILNNEIIVNIDKSITRDRKLENILKDGPR